MSDVMVRRLQSTWGLTQYHLVMLALVKWGNPLSGQPDACPPCWYDATARSMKCRICGVEAKTSRSGLDQYEWVRKHEHVHVNQVGHLRVKAFLAMLKMQGADKPKDTAVMVRAMTSAGTMMEGGSYRLFDMPAIIAIGRAVFG